MLKLFARYSSVGVVSTAIHWSVFTFCFYAWSSTQVVANLAGFLCAASFGFIANARFTFQSPATKTRYLLFIAFMGLLSITTGWLADTLQLTPWLTLIATSLLSLLLGFSYSKQVVFRR